MNNTPMHDDSLVSMSVVLGYFSVYNWLSPADSSLSDKSAEIH